MGIIEFKKRLLMHKKKDVNPVVPVVDGELQYVITDENICLSKDTGLTFKNKIFKTVAYKGFDTSAKYLLMAVDARTTVNYSENEGLSWEQSNVGNPLIIPIEKIVLSSNGKYGIFNTHSADLIYITSDYGRTWKMNGMLSGKDISLSADGKIMVVTKKDNYAVLSTNYGKSWRADNNLAELATVFADGSGFATYDSYDNVINIYNSNGSKIKIVRLKILKRDTIAEMDSSANGQYIIFRTISNGSSSKAYLYDDKKGSINDITPVENYDVTAIAISSSGQYINVAVNSNGTGDLYRAYKYGTRWRDPINFGNGNIIKFLKIIK